MTTEPTTHPLVLVGHVHDDAHVLATPCDGGVSFTVYTAEWQHVTTLYLTPGKAAELRDALNVTLGTAAVTR